MTTRIAYYSWKGHTGKVAATLAETLGAELVQIEPLKTFNIGIQAAKAFFSMKSPIKPGNTDLAGVDRLIVVTPVWCGKVPPFVSAYCAGITGGDGKPFHVVTEMGGQGADTATAVVRKHLESKGMRFISSAATLERDVESGTYIAQIKLFAAAITG